MLFFSYYLNMLTKEGKHVINHKTKPDSQHSSKDIVRTESWPTHTMEGRFIPLQWRFNLPNGSKVFVLNLIMMLLLLLLTKMLEII